MARDATARLYDVDAHAVEFSKLDKTVKYDQGEIAFRAKEGKLIELDKLRESLWATRLSGGTRSGVVQLEVTAVGEAIREGDQITFHVPGSADRFVLIEDPEARRNGASATAFESLVQALQQGERVTEVTGRVDGWKGRWPSVLGKHEPKPRRILVSHFE